jgi:hypothetical protein
MSNSIGDRGCCLGPMSQKALLDFFGKISFSGGIPKSCHAFDIDPVGVGPVQQKKVHHETTSGKRSHHETAILYLSGGAVVHVCPVS